MDFDKEIENQRIKNDLQEIPVLFYCDKCNKEIYKGNEYFINEYGNNLCEECFDELQSMEKKECSNIAGEE